MSSKCHLGRTVAGPNEVEFLGATHDPVDGERVIDWRLWGNVPLFGGSDHESHDPIGRALLVERECGAFGGVHVLGELFRCKGAEAAYERLRDGGGGWSAGFWMPSAINGVSPYAVIRDFTFGAIPRDKRCRTFEAHPVASFRPEEELRDRCHKAMGYASKAGWDRAWELVRPVYPQLRKYQQDRAVVVAKDPPARVIDKAVTR